MKSITWFRATGPLVGRQALCQNTPSRPEQKKRMDDLLDENRAALVNRYQALQQEESKIESLSRAPTLEETTIFAQIDLVAQAGQNWKKQIPICCCRSAKK
jgi:hypothetical protein